MAALGMNDTMITCWHPSALDHMARTLINSAIIHDAICVPTVLSYMCPVIFHQASFLESRARRSSDASEAALLNQKSSELRLEATAMRSAVFGKDSLTLV